MDNILSFIMANIPFLIFIGVFPLMIYIGYLGRQKQKAKMKDIAMKLGLQLSEGRLTPQITGRPQNISNARDFNTYQASKKLAGNGFIKELLSMMSPLSLTGKYKGYDVRITVTKRDKATYTEFKTAFPRPLGLGLKINANNLLLKQFILGQKGKTVQAGNEPFDKKIQVNGNDPLKIKYLLTLENQRSLLDLFSVYPSTVVDDQGISISVRGFTDDSQKCSAVLDRMTAAAKHFSHN
ncbi:hypothetical protein HY768_00415 [candidate division TA06 bacterium]|uniref:Uncharacterized protein n=1 Tax=candidate division TA06 bacterium TaxID=2250710 RepID=A0A933I7K5_UNCT6|nr:hypothetical protein [candidate division TA06 bacterium]